jgi:hypothetical protein
MSKEKIKLSLEQMPNDSTAVLTVPELGDLLGALEQAHKEAEKLTDEKREGRVEITFDEDRITVAVKKAKIEKEEDDGS